MYFTDKHGALLCEKPSWGHGWSRCQHIGAAERCMKYSEPLKLTRDGWVQRCDTCAAGGYAARSSPPQEVFQPMRKFKSPAGKFHNSKEIREMTRSAPGGIPPKMLLMACMDRASGRVTKSLLLETAAGFYWEGYASSTFTTRSQQLRKAFEELCAEGVFLYEKGKSVVLNKK